MLHFTGKIEHLQAAAGAPHHRPGSAIPLDKRAGRGQNPARSFPEQLLRFGTGDLTRSRFLHVSEGHGVSSISRHELHQWRILGELESGGAVSQRVLARKVGIALGLTNRLVRELVRRRLVQLSHDDGVRVRYQITQAGSRQQARMARALMHEAVRACADAKARIERRLTALAATGGERAEPRRVVFYDDGSGVAEIGWICLQRMGLRLVGVVGESAGASVCHLEVQPWERLHGRELGGEPFDRLVVMSFGPMATIRGRLRQCGVPRGVPFWI